MKKELTNSHVIKLFKCDLLIFSLFEISDRFLIQHRKIAETLQNDFTKTILHDGCDTLLNHCYKIPTMLRCPLFVILQQNIPAILQCNVFGQIFYEDSKIKTISIHISH